MKTRKLNLASEQGKLSRLEMKMLSGGDAPPPDDDSSRCLGCNTNYDCARVNKGTCDYCSTHGKNCCSGWHSH